jgi:hypothetical protein
MKDKPIEETRRLCGQRDSERCVRCGKSLYNVPASLHHRRLRGTKGFDTHLSANLIWLCGSGTTGCHGYVHAHPAESYEKGWMVHSWATPSSVPVLTALNGLVTLDNAYRYKEVDSSMKGGTDADYSTNEGTHNQMAQ